MYQAFIAVGSLYNVLSPKLSTNSVRELIMAALRSRCGHYIFTLWFLLLSSFFLSSPNLSLRRLDVYHTYTHGMALVRI